MSASATATPTGDLALGMYVSRLDRPWLETPFLFQGFTIQSEDEIQTLRRYCQNVYVDRERSTQQPSAPNLGSLDQPRTEPLRKTSFFERLSRWIAKPREPLKDALPGEFYTDKVTLEVELVEAKKIHVKASSLLVRVMEEIRRGGKLDLGVLDTVVTPMIETVLRNQDALAWLSRIKRMDDYTYGHSVSCSVYAITFGRHLGLERADLKVLGLGGLLLDVGKTKIPKSLLCKRESLSEDEIALVHQHVQLGEKIVRQVQGIDERVLEMVASHHERYDGSGYPRKLSGLDIPVFARIGGIVDFYDALITPRPYARPISSYDAIRKLHKRSGTEFQDEMVNHFVQAVGMFPCGALVELSTGEVAVVVEQNRVRRLRPKVMLILGREKERLEKPITVDLRQRPAEPGEEGAVWIDRGLESDAFGIDPAEYFL